MGLVLIPHIIGMLGPHISASINPIFFIFLEKAMAKLIATVDLPTPPLPLATARYLSIFGSFIF